MYRVIKADGTELGITDAVTYIKFGTGGDFTFATQNDAIGVAFDSIAYNLIGHTEIEGAETVVVMSVDGGAEIYKISNAVGTLLGVSEQ